MQNRATQKVSMAVIRRLPKYHRYLEGLLHREIFRISSKELSRIMGLTASQIRQDLNCFGVLDSRDMVIMWKNSTMR